MVRVFIAVDFPDNVIQEVARIQECLEKINFTGKLTELENLHLTLKFLGEVNEDDIPGIIQTLEEIKVKPFEAKLEKIGLFSYKRNPKVVWIKVVGKEIHALQKMIDESLRGKFNAEERFMSHLTVARVKYVWDKKGFIDYLDHLNVKKVSFNVMGFKLIKSELKPLGPVYTIIKEFKLN